MFYIPASVLAGLMGLVLGPQFLNVIPWSGKIGSYAYMLVCVLFGGLFLGKKDKTNVKQILTKVGDSFCVNMGAEFFCFGIALLVGGALMKNFVSKCIYRNCPADAIWILRWTWLCFNDWNGT